MGKRTPEQCRAKYRKNPRKFMDKAAKRVRRDKARYWAWKASQKCLVCGEGRHWCLVAHHRDPSTKKAELSQLAGRCSWARIEAELAKCDILCCNCHADLHWRIGRRGAPRRDDAPKESTY